MIGLGFGLGFSAKAGAVGATPTDGLLMEGDMQSGTDRLSLEGDMQSGTDVLLLEGDMQNG